MNNRNNNRVVLYALISALIVVAPVYLYLRVVDSSASAQTESFICAYIYIIGHNILLFGSLILFIARLTIWKKAYGSFPYVFGAVINSLIGLAAIYLFYYQHYTREFLHDALWNLLVGFVLLSEVFLNDGLKENCS